MMTARRTAMLGGTLALALAGCSNEEGPVAASTTAGGNRTNIEAQSRAALDELYRTRPGFKQLGEHAKAILVFPSVTQAGLGIGGLYGNGTLFEGGKAVEFYNIAGGTFGFQIGAQSFAQAYFFNTADALDTFRKLKGFQVGAGATAVAADYGADGTISTQSLQKPVVTATWGQSGLMAGVTLEGAKITQINP